MLTDFGASIMSPVYWAGKWFKGGLECPVVQFCLANGGGKIQLSLSSGMSYRSFCSLLLWRRETLEGHIPGCPAYHIIATWLRWGVQQMAVWCLDAMRPVRTAPVLTSSCADPLGCPCGVWEMVKVLGWVTKIRYINRRIRWCFIAAKFEKTWLLFICSAK